MSEPNVATHIAGNDSIVAGDACARSLVKETRQLLRDKSNLMVGLFLPLVLILLFGYGLSFDVKHAPVAIVTEDTSPDGPGRSCRASICRRISRRRR